ncbi:MAG: hypothetical protein AAFO04_24080 [Cyanobacteria bacterium J06592_8]
MQYKYFIDQLSIGSNLIFSVLRKKRLFDEQGEEIPLADSIANFRCTLTPSLDIDFELAKLSADGAELNPELIAMIDNELKQTLQIWWTPERVLAYEELQQLQNPIN